VLEILPKQICSTIKDRVVITMKGISKYPVLRAFIRNLARKIISSSIVFIIVGVAVLSGGCVASNDEGEGFAIYLTRDDILPANMEALSHVDLADTYLVGMEDIVSYNQQTHVLKLTQDAYDRLAKLEVRTSGKSFLVCVDKSPMYWGAFWTLFSSQSFDGITIWQPLSTSKAPLVTIRLGYPSSSFYGGEDPRSKPEIIQAFKNAGKLATEWALSDIESLPGSMKGYELYSWQEADGWHFALITGTNRNKTIGEITSRENTLSETGLVYVHGVGEEAVKAILDKVPSGTWVSWRDGSFVTDGNSLEYPSQDFVDRIRNHAAACGLDFCAPD
jgi:hypothetical protein